MALSFRATTCRAAPSLSSQWPNSQPTAFASSLPLPPWSTTSPRNSKGTRCGRKTITNRTARARKRCKTSLRWTWPNSSCRTWVPASGGWRTPIQSFLMSKSCRTRPRPTGQERPRSWSSTTAERSGSTGGRDSINDCVINIFIVLFHNHALRHKTKERPQTNITPPNNNQSNLLLNLTSF